MWKEHGTDFSYDLCPRAKIFRRDQGGVTDLASLKHIMRYNSTYSRLITWIKNNISVCQTIIRVSSEFWQNG